jgi:glycosyltransferase involved in cell wall biosynthesis
MLARLVGALERLDVASDVVSLSGGGAVADELRSRGVKVRELGMERGRLLPGKIATLARWIREGRPDVVQTWMYHANLVGGLATRLEGDVPVVWGIRQGSLDPAVTRWSTLLTATVCARLSGTVPSRIVVCSEAARTAHRDHGYAEDRMVVIPNGFDAARFRPDETARRDVRREFGIHENAVLIGLVARFDPTKDHATFVKAAASLRAQHPDVRFLLCGTAITEENRELMDLVESAGLRQSTCLLGRRADVNRLFAALDILASSSSCEGFPNAIAEAMTCGVPCAVTDVGESAYVVGDTGMVVPPGRPDLLAESLRSLVDLGAPGRRALGSRARDRIMREFALDAVAVRYETLWKGAIGSSP